MAVRGGTVDALADTSPVAITVGSSSAKVLAARPGRMGSSWVNASTAAITLGLGADAVAGSGIYLAPNGGAWDGMIGPLVWVGSVFAVASGSGNQLCIVEV